MSIERRAVSMRISRIIRSDMMSLALVLLMYCSSVMGKESGEEVVKKSSHPKLVYVEGGTFLINIRDVYLFKY